MGFFQWQINEDGCSRLKLDAPSLANSEKKVNITMGTWDSRRYDITFANVTLPFVLGNSNTNFITSNGSWYVVKVAFLNNLTSLRMLRIIISDCLALCQVIRFIL